MKCIHGGREWRRRPAVGRLRRLGPGGADRARRGVEHVEVDVGLVDLRGVEGDVVAPAVTAAGLQHDGVADRDERCADGREDVLALVDVPAAEVTECGGPLPVAHMRRCDREGYGGRRNGRDVERHRWRARRKGEHACERAEMRERASHRGCWWRACPGWAPCQGGAAKRGRIAGRQKSPANRPTNAWWGTAAATRSRYSPGLPLGPGVGTAA